MADSDKAHDSDVSGRRQLIAGALTTAFAYAAGFATNFAGVIPDPVQTLVHDASLWHAPLHIVFALGTATVGAAGVAVWEHFRNKAPTPR